MIAMRCMFCRKEYRKGSTPYPDGVCPACQAELDAVPDDELPDKRRELMERYEDRRSGG